MTAAVRRRGTEEVRGVVTWPHEAGRISPRSSTGQRETAAPRLRAARGKFLYIVSHPLPWLAPAFPLQPLLLPSCSLPGVVTLKCFLDSSRLWLLALRGSGTSVITIAGPEVTEGFAKTIAPGPAYSGRQRSLACPERDVTDVYREGGPRQLSLP